MSALALQPAYRERLVALLGMLGSDHDGERATAARLADEHLRRSGLTWNDVVLAAPDPCEPKPKARRKRRAGSAPRSKPKQPKPPSWEDQAEAVAGEVLATAWERDFAANLLHGWSGRNISAKQAEVLDRIYAAKCERRQA